MQVGQFIKCLVEARNELRHKYVVTLQVAKQLAVIYCYYVIRRYHASSVLQV